MSDAPERIWMDPDIRFPECEKQYSCDIEYVRADRIEELEDKLARADFRRRLCRGKYLACRIEELEAKLAKAVELALEECPYVDGTGAYLDWWFERRATLAKLKGNQE